LDPIERLQKLATAIDLEHKYEKTLYLESISKKSIHELVVDGIAWYPLQIAETGYSIGEYPYLTLEIAEDKLKAHKFRSGAIIQFFQNLDGDIQKNAVSGTIFYISRNRVKIILEQNELPDWYDEGKIGIIIDYDEKSIKEMKAALVEIINAKDSAAADIRDILYRNKTRNANHPQSFFPKNKQLNASQIHAIENILGCEDIAIIHGPPGTGKTTTIVEAILQLTKKEPQILVTAPSNSAVDLLVEKLHDSDLRVIRIGNLSRISEEILSHTLDSKIENSPEFLEIKKLRKKADEFRKMAHKYKRNFGADEREQRRLLLSEVKDIHKHIIWIEDYLVHKILDNAQVICTTLVGCQTKYLKNRTFSTCFIDEVSQALEPATWIPILKSTKLVLAGDPFQLPPTVKNIEAEKLGLAQTILDIGFQLTENVFLLDTQYRMKSEIMGFSNLIFYNNKLKAAPNTDTHFFQIGGMMYPPLIFIDTAGCGYEEMKNAKTESLYTPDECKLLFDYLEQLMMELTYAYSEISIGIIAPYREQVLYMKQYDFENKQLCAHHNIDIDTIDSFQGQERDIIFISMVRSNNESQIGFLNDYRRMNVAFTRAKGMVRVFGDSATLSQDEFYSKWIDYCHSVAGYKSAWELIG
jgi:superfamily I DNA and/or RNA helicase